MIDISKSVDRIAYDLMSIKSPTGKEQAIFKRIKQTLEGNGIGLESESANNAVYSFYFGKEKTIAYVGHLDTVGASIPTQYSPIILKGQLYGRGAVDMKSGLACMLKLANDFKRGNLTPKHNVSLVFYSGEEGPLPNGLNKLIDNGSLDGIDFAYVLEPTRGKYGIGCLGSITANIHIPGKSAHSALPEKGVNAIYSSLPIISGLNEFRPEKRILNGTRVSEALNITRANTSNEHNVIPNEFVLTVNYRFLWGRTLSQAKQRLKDIVLSERTSKTGKIRIEFLDESPSCLVRNEHTKEFLQKGIESKLFRGWTDIAQLNLAGIPAVNYGPGRFDLAHKADERISVQELRDFYTTLAQNLNSK